MHFSVPAAVFILAFLGYLTACGGESTDLAPSTGAVAPAAVDIDPSAETAPLTVYRPGENACVADGALRGRLYGAVAAELDWRAESMSCEGMPRPHGEGARLRFSGLAGDLKLAIIVAMPSLERGVAMEAVPSKVTIIEEGQGRFFSAADLDTCWTDVDTDPAAPDASSYRVEGVLYCIAPLAEVGGDASVTVDEIEFVGQLGWEAGP